MSLGFLLFIAFYAQTEGLRFTSVSNAGFITGMLVPLVPLLSWLAFRHKITKAGWIAVCLSTAGLYGLTGGANTALNKGDILVLIGAIAFASHIVLTGHYAQKLPIISLSILQMLAVSIYSLLASWLFDHDPSKTLFSLNPEHWLQL
ncbi:DMT family transporter, partial [Halorubrum tibetense]